MDALRGSAATLLIFDRTAAHSDHALRHLQVARQSGKPLIPLRVGPSDEGVLGQELAGVRWIDWSKPDLAVAEIRRRAYELSPAQQGRPVVEPASAAIADPGHSAPQPSRPPRIEVLGAGAGAGAAAAAAAATHGAGSAHAQPQAAPVRTQPQSVAFEPHPHPATDRDYRNAAPAAAATRRKSPFTSPTLLLALLALAAVVGAILYNSSLFRGGDTSGEREVAQQVETVPEKPPLPDLSTAPAGDAAPASEGPWGPATEGTEPDLPAEPAAPAPSEVAAAPAPTPAPTVAPAPAPAPREVAAAQTPRPPVAAPAARAPAEAPAPQPASGDASGAAATVRSFYSALSGGNGAAAAQHVIPGKRGSGPLSAGSLTRYYSSFRRPLRIRSVTPVDADTVRVAYDYVLSDGRLCQGQASVNVVQSGGRSLVSGIRTRGPC
jgi:hypothetical protein